MESEESVPRERGEEPRAESDDDSVPGLHPRGEESDDDDSVDTIVYESDSDDEVDPEPVPVKPRINKFQGADPKKTHKMKTRGSKQDGNVMETSTEDDARTTSTAASTECKEEWDDFDMIGKWLEEASDLNVHFVHVDEEQEDLAKCLSLHGDRLMGYIDKLKTQIHGLGAVPVEPE